MGLNGALHAASRSLEVFTAGIQVAGQNIANAGTPGYIREELHLNTNSPYQKGSLIFGTGVTADGIRQQIDQFLETRIHSANTELAASRARENAFLQLESEIRSLGDADLSSQLNRFLATIDDVVNEPESSANRQLVIQQGEQLAGEIVSLRRRLDQLREAQTIQVDAMVKEANDLIRQISDLNVRISKMEASGLLKSDAGALRTQRYDALNRLSEIIPINYRERQDGSIDVFTSSDYLVMAHQTQQLEMSSQVDRGVPIQYVTLSKTKSELSMSGGELRGVIEGRDTILGGFIDELDRFAAQLIREFNQIHTSGEGLQGFTGLTSTEMILDSDAALNAVGLAFPPKHGSFSLKVSSSSTGQTKTSDIAVDLDGIGTETTLESLRDSLDAVEGINATITTTGRLVIEAEHGYEFRFADDTSGVLAALGFNTFFTGSDSSNIGINSALAQNSGHLATSLGGGPSDNRNALALLEFAQQPIDSLNGDSLKDFYSGMVSRVAQNASSEKAVTSGLSAFRQSLMSQREQFSGVSLDEEAIKILELQRAFQSAARLISTIDELFTTLLNI